MHSFHYRNGTLVCEDYDLRAAAEKFGTPLYLYSSATMLDHYRRLDAALAEVDHLICYAVKANSNRAVLKLFADAGAGFDIVSGGELYRVVQSGGDPTKCSFAGVGKSREEIEYALDQRVHSFNVESESELECIDQIAAKKNVRAPIALRVNPDVDPHTHHYISTGSHENKFGIALEHVSGLYDRAAGMTHIEIVGVQMHIGSQITEAEPFAAAIGKVAPLVRELKATRGLKFFSIGGGMGIIYRRALESGAGKWWHDHGGEASAFSVRDYADAILPQLRDLGIRILLEPGRYLVGNAGVLLTRVRYLKKTGRKKFVIVDAGMNDLIRPALYQSYHEIVPVEEPTSGAGTAGLANYGRGTAGLANYGRGTAGLANHGQGTAGLANYGKGTAGLANQGIEKMDIVGPVCESGDFFATDREMPAVCEGDLLAVMSAGAYGFVMASNYNSRPLPAEVLVRGDKAALIRRRQEIADLVRDEVDPVWA